NESERRQQEQMLVAVARFCRELKEWSLSSKRGDGQWLSLLGCSGNGKTYLAKRIFQWALQWPQLSRADTYVDKSGRTQIEYPGSLQWWPELTELLSGNQGYDRLNELMHERIVVLDEIGADRDPN